ncbi:LysM peptidoglycan-binding domain-containing protein [Lacihabitans sp. LS3-19]|uniref:lytic transglycosylase n=1 Tax=Lacihabitans sp. LS3-19 TaxID=2487335 RepID=UPI0020CC7B45|nr:LysM peptidoglycan-binding domain-containing protein [Lacihabitans sp. LS3-19]MCP9769425.1 LysM peptidoglycan-binding domain-containing protein [Lacihabitans sp. LS3-19]
MKKINLVILLLSFLSFFACTETKTKEDVVGTIPDTLISVGVDSLQKSIDSIAFIQPAPTATPELIDDNSTEIEQITDVRPALPADKPNLIGKDLWVVVRPKDSWGGIAFRFNMKEETLRKLNPGITTLKRNQTKLNVKVQAKHICQKGDILKVVARKYGITVEQLMLTNRKEKNHTNLGEVLIVPLATLQ